MIKAIIFDYGNVISTFNNEICLDRISATTGKDKEQVREIIYGQSQIQKKFETGLLTSKEFYRELSTACGLNVSIKKLIDIYSKDKYTLIPGIEKLIKQLKLKYKIGLLSNTCEWDYIYVVKTAPFVKTFDTITTSFEVKAMKPDPKIYQDALTKLKLKPEECIYIDDIPSYVEAAKNLGLNALQFTTVEKLKSDLFPHHFSRNYR